jgi:hypothetical protein
MRDLAGKFGMSDVGLKKHCLRVDVPVPERGYWNKLNAGKPVIQTKLRPRGPGMPDLVTIGGEQRPWRYDPEAELAEPLPAEPAFPEPIESVRERVAKRVGKVPMVRSLTTAHPAVRKLLEADEKRREKQASISYLSSFYAPYFDSGFEQRRLKVLNSLFLALAKFGAKPFIGRDKARDLAVMVGNQTLQLRLDHPSAKPNRHGEWSTRPGKADTLQLAIVDGSSEKPKRTWSETSERKLDDQLTEIVVELIVQGEIDYREGARRLYEWRIQRKAELEEEVRKRKAEAERKAREQLIKEEREAREALLTQARALRDAGDIRTLVAAVTAQARNLGSEEAAKDWASWALAVADRIDPLTNMKIVEGRIDLTAELLD